VSRLSDIANNNSVKVVAILSSGHEIEVEKTRALAIHTELEQRSLRYWYELDQKIVVAGGHIVGFRIDDNPSLTG